MNILIKNGKVVDGTGNPWFYYDIEIEDGKIKQMKRKLEVKADRTIDAEGLVVAPGFIDAHCHADGPLVFRPALEEYKSQGITTTTFGSDGMGLYPDKKSFLEWSLQWYGSDTNMYSKVFAKSAYDWHSLTDLCQLIMSQGPAINSVPLLGLGPILFKVGYEVKSDAEVRRLTAEEMAKVKSLISQGFKEGAVGLSSSRDYPPDKWLEIDDYVEILKEVKKHNGVFFPHTILVGTPQGVREAIKMAKLSGVELHILHVVVAPNWQFGTGNNLREVLGLIDSAREDGVDVTFDVSQDLDFIYRKDGLTRQIRFFCRVYGTPPPKGVESLEQFHKNLEDPSYREMIKRTTLEVIGRSERYAAAFWQNHLDNAILTKTGDEKLEGKTVGQIAKGLGVNATDLFFDMAFNVSPVLRDRPHALVTLPRNSGHPNAENVLEASLHPLAMPSSDYPVFPTPPEYFYMGSAPWGIMPTYFRRTTARGQRLEETIRKMTSAPARVFGLTDRGILRPGMKADIVIFDPVEFRSVADYDHQNARAEGVHYVMVNGRLVLDKGELTEERPGEVLVRG
ncbi:amidohydrolase family protein [Chloroflexota bacterium]